MIQNFHKCLWERFQKIRYIKVTEFGGRILYLKRLEIKIILIINSTKNFVHFSSLFELKKRLNFLQDHVYTEKYYLYILLIVVYLILQIGYLNLN